MLLGKIAKGCCANRLCVLMSAELDSRREVGKDLSLTQPDLFCSTISSSCST